MFLNTWNQSIVQQLMSDGNWRSLERKVFPMGLIAIIICIFSVDLFTKYEYKAKGDKSAPSSFSAKERTA